MGDAEDAPQGRIERIAGEHGEMEHRHDVLMSIKSDLPDPNAQVVSDSGEDSPEALEVDDEDDDDSDEDYEDPWTNEFLLYAQPSRMQHIHNNSGHTSVEYPAAADQDDHSHDDATCWCHGTDVYGQRRRKSASLVNDEPNINDYDDDLENEGTIPDESTWVQDGSSLPSASSPLPTPTKHSVFPSDLPPTSNTHLHASTSTSSVAVQTKRRALKKRSATRINTETKSAESLQTPNSTTTPLPKRDIDDSYLELLEPGSQRNKDSVLHYFVATKNSEEDLDKYLSSIIQAFLDNPSAIHASNKEDPSVTKTYFTTSKVPQSGDPGTSLEHYLSSVKATVIDKATRVSSSKMIGHMTTALPYFHRPLARLLTAMNQNVVKLETASTMTYLERETIAMMHREFYAMNTNFYNLYMHSFEHSMGVFTSGGTIANITAMWTARNKALKADAEKGFRGIDKEGLFKALKVYGYEGAVIVGSAMMHYSFKKAADLLGLGDEGIDELRRQVEELIAKNILIIAIVGIAGTTETGSIDNLKATASICKAHNIHFHVDAAWGGPFIFSREHKYKLNGISSADTITVDPHKQLYTPLGLGLLLFRSPTDPTFIRKTANYVIRHDSPDLGKFTLEGSRPATSLHLHATFHLLGRDGIESLVTRSATLVRQMAVRLDTHPSHAFQVLHEPSTNILLYRYVPQKLRDKVQACMSLESTEDELLSEATRRIQTRQAKEGVKGFVSRTRVFRRKGVMLDSEEVVGGDGGRWVDAFRVVIANPLTRWEDVEGVIGEQLVMGVEVEKEMEVERPSRGGKDEVKMWIGWPLEM
ncbi:hypothetical protein HDV05_007985 [Chytridiales sp. JEL 0842]|nr:hypothetical protein HDV05_007985 [Chytridiales sp. JEL 0842]